MIQFSEQSFEPEAVAASQKTEMTIQTIATMSAAISLKRIADALSPTTPGDASINDILWEIMEKIK